VRFDSEEEKSAAAYKFLWISEKFYLEGILQFVSLAKGSAQRSLHELQQPMNAVFNDIIRLDFTKFKQVLSEYQVAQHDLEREERDAIALHKLAVQQAEAAGQPVPSRGKPTVRPELVRMQKMAALLKQMARAALFALNSQSWLQLVSIILYVWNAFAYDLTTPLELCLVPEAWHSVVVIAECSLYLLEFLQRGGRLRTLAGQDIDRVKN